MKNRKKILENKRVVSLLLDYLFIYKDTSDRDTMREFCKTVCTTLKEEGFSNENVRYVYMHSYIYGDGSYDKRKPENGATITINEVFYDRTLSTSIELNKSFMQKVFNRQ